MQKKTYDKETTHLEIEKPPETRLKKRRWKLALSLLGVLIVFRISLPYIALKYVNNKLKNLKEYTGHVKRIDIALIRGAYIIRDLSIIKINSKDTTPFFISPKIDLSVEWRALLKGKIVGEIYIEDPVLSFVKGEHKKGNLKADTSDFRKLIKDLIPFTVNHFEIINGHIRYLDNTTVPKINVGLQELKIVVTNFSNVNKTNKLLPAYLEASSRIYGGEFMLKINFDPLNRTPTFDMNAELVNLDLVSLNDFLKAYGNFFVEKGRFGLYMEFAAKEGELGGYVKPIIRDLNVIQLKGNAKEILWEMIVGTGAELFANQKADQVATKIPIKGKFNDPDINIWQAVSYILRNAFVTALKPIIDNSINIQKLEEPKKTLLEKIFNKRKQEQD